MLISVCNFQINTPIKKRVIPIFEKYPRYFWTAKSTQKPPGDWFVPAGTPGCCAI